MTDDTDTITFELPLEPDEDRLSVDALFTALDHASAYHSHEETNRYVQLYDRLQTHLYDQAREQINIDD